MKRDGNICGNTKYPTNTMQLQDKDELDWVHVSPSTRGPFRVLGNAVLNNFYDFVHQCSLQLIKETLFFVSSDYAHLQLT